MTAITAVNIEPAKPTSSAAAINVQVFSLMLQGDYENAYRLCKEALRREPDNMAVRANLATILKSLGREPEAIAIYEQLLREKPDYGTAINNLAYSYIRGGRYKQGWRMYHQRLRSNAENTRLPINPLTGIPVYCDRPPSLDELHRKHIIIVPEQGIGDELLFLRFVPHLARLTDARSIWYAPSVKLFAILKRCPEITSLCTLTDMRFPGAPKTDATTIMLADLPMIIEHDGSWFPESLRLPEDVIEPERFEEPTLGVTWRAGTVDGTHRGHLFKMVPPREMGEALKDAPYRVRVIQRGAKEEEMVEFSQGLGRPFDTWETPRGASTELLKVTAFLGGLSAYVGPSNTNTHIRGLLGKDQHVMLGLPGEWRWPITHERSSPWFPQMKVYRKEMRDQWQPALERLRDALK